MGGNKVFQHRKPLAEAGGNRALNDFAGGLGHQAAHAGKLPDLVPVASGPGIHHEVNRVEIFPPLVVLQSPVHGRRDFLGRLGPDVDDLVVPLAVRDGAHAVLFFHQGHRLTGPVDHLRLVLRNDHVVDTDRHTCPGRGRKAKVLQLVQTLHRLAVTAFFVAPENDLAELLLSRRFVEETDFGRPNAIKPNPARGCLNKLLRRIPKDGFLAVVGVFKENEVVGFNTSLADRKVDLVRVFESTQALLFIA